MLDGGGVPLLAHRRAGDRAKPLLVFLPGGGHLGRIAYGHPGGAPRDFLAHWLGERGFGFLALSHPGEHPDVPLGLPAMTSAEWASCAAAAVKGLVERDGLAPAIVLLAWSMGGRVMPAFARAAARLGLDLRCFVSLAASPPLPGLAGWAPGGEPLTPAGFWDLGPRTDGFAAQLAEQGPDIIPDAVYRRDYLCATPLGLRGAGQDVGAGDGMLTVEAATFDFAHLPPVAMLVPSRPSDPSHALTDRTVWGLLIQRRLYARYCAGRRIAPEAWPELVALVRGAPDALARDVDGGHFFFIGESGARITAGYVDDLIDASEEVEGRIAVTAGSTSQFSDIAVGRPHP